MTEIEVDEIDNFMWMLAWILLMIALAHFGERQSIVFGIVSFILFCLYFYGRQLK